MFDIESLKAADLRGGRIAEILGAAMTGGDEDFIEAVEAAKDIGEAVLDAFEQRFGWRPPTEIGEYSEAEAALAAYARNAEEFWLEELGGWIFAIDLADLSDEARDGDAMFAWADDDPLADPMMLVTGLVQFGMDASGDTCFVSLLPHPDDIAEVWWYDHEVGEIDGLLGHSVSETLLTNWLYEDEHPEVAALCKSTFGSDWERGREPTAIGEKLFERSSWLIDMLRGHEGYAFAARLAKAPTFDTWLAEEDAAGSHPHLAFYWMFAHFFLGNLDACREATSIAAEHGSAGARLAEMVERVLEDHEASLGDVEADTLTALRGLVYRNAEPTQLDPSLRELVVSDRGEVHTDRAEVEAALEAGDDPMQIIEAHPDDVELHDEMLDRIGADDEEFAELVEDYRSEREDDAYNEWPWFEEPLDPRLSIPVSAAFRSGLKYSASHPKAYGGITRTLSKFDDDHALTAYRAAIETLQPDDDRLEYVIAQLSTSEHPDAHAVLVTGAMRFFEHLDELVEKQQQRAKQWPSLDDMFRVDDYLIRALLHAMRTDDDHDETQREAVERLARKTLSHGGALATLGIAWARAMQVVASYELDDLAYLARGYIETFRDTIDHETAEWLRDEVCINLAESCRTLALHDSDGTYALLRPIFTMRFGVPAYRADVIGSILAGLIVVDPDEEGVLEWTERILGSRCERRPIRLYGALVGVAEAKLEAARDWVWPHLWAGYSGISDSPSLIGATAQKTIEALGVDEIPQFDDSDWYSRKVSGEQELIEALDAPHLHGAEDVFERMRRENLRSAAVATRVGDWFVDSLRFAEDDPDRTSHRDRWEAMKVLLNQGDYVIAQFERIFSLEHIGGEWLGYATQFARFSALLAHTIGWLEDASDQEILGAITQREARLTAFLDHLAAEAIVRGLDAHDALRSACDWRFAFAYSYSLSDDLVASRLPRLYAMVADSDSYVRAQHEGAPSLAVDFWKQALETTETPEPKSLFDGDGVMVLAATSEELFNSPLSMRLELSGTSVGLTCTVEDFYTHSVLDDASWRGRYDRSYDDEQAATEAANHLLRRLAVLGYTLT